MEKLVLNNGVEMPNFGLGTYLIKPDDAEVTVREGLKMGYRLIDTANAYSNERAVGRGIKASGVDRKEIFLSTKLWITEYENENAVDETLERLGVDYIDLLFIHQPGGNYIAGYRMLEKAYKEGKIKAIGISNFEGKYIEEILEKCEIKPQVIQVEAHPYFTQDELRKTLDKENIKLMSWYPLGHGDSNLMNEESIEKAKFELESLSFKGKVLAIKADITKESDVENLINEVLKESSKIDIWINNAGVNQPNKPVWELDVKTIDRLIDVDLKETILCSNKILPIMIKQNHGQLYNVEGHGSNDATITGLSLYGTSKRAVTYFTESLAHEVEDKKCNVCIGKITPGIMITNFINTSLGDGEHIELDEKTKKFYNILGDYPETIANFMVDKIINNKKNNVKFAWLTNKRAAIRFITSPFNKRKFFK